MNLEPKKKTCSWTQVWNSVQTWAWRPRSLWTWRPQTYFLLVTTAIYSQHARQDTSMREHVLILVSKTLAKTAWLPKLLHRNMFCFVSALFGNWILSRFLCLHTYHILQFLICLTHWIVCVFFWLNPMLLIYTQTDLYSVLYLLIIQAKNIRLRLCLYMNPMFFSATPRTSFQVWGILFTMKSCCYLAKSSHVY